MRVGSLCSGYGGLDLAVEAVMGGELAWWSDVAPEACQVMEAHWPGVPNVGDLTTADWGDVEPIDVLTAGYPCQPFSHAGKRRGEEDERHLWPHIGSAIGVLRPRWVVLENVAGHLVLGFDRVLGDLAGLGFDAEWCLVRASDVGACHQRKRLFVVAWDTHSSRLEGRRTPNGAGERAVGTPSVDSATDAGGVGQRPGPGLRQDGPSGQRWGRLGDDDGPAPADTDRGGFQIDSESDGGETESELGASRWHHPDGSGPTVAEWGDYTGAIARHEHALGRAAPPPTDDQRRLNPRFVEWMMMLPEGWVCDVVQRRTNQLRLLGNGVVPPQAAYAIAGLLERMSEREVAA